MNATSPELSFYNIENKARNGVRIGREKARWLWKNASDAQLSELATDVRNRFHAADICTYFYRLPGQEEGYVMAQAEVFAKLDELLALGGDLAAFNAGSGPTSRISRRLVALRSERGNTYGTMPYAAFTWITSPAFVLRC